VKKNFTLTLCLFFFVSCKTSPSARSSNLYAAETHDDTSDPHPVGISVGVTGFAAPNFSLSSVRFLGTNSDGSANLSLTFTCNEKQTGLGASADCSGFVLSTQLDYIFVPDNYSQREITIAQANEAFATHVATAITTETVVDPGGSDLNGNTLPHGGFYTSLVTGTTPIFPDKLSYVVMLRARDTTHARNTQSYLYIYVNIPELKQE
jgi:hypothetical protein